MHSNQAQCRLTLLNKANALSTNYATTQHSPVDNCTESSYIDSHGHNAKLTSSLHSVPPNHLISSKIVDTNGKPAARTMTVE